MKTHTTKGANILRPVPQLSEMLPGIELHHEALNGRGYPYGLKGDHIPLLARVIAVADTFDALTTNRPYQQAHDPIDALRIIENLSGQRLDPKAVTALMAVFYRGEIRIQKTPALAMAAEVSAPARTQHTAADPLIIETTRDSKLPATPCNLGSPLPPIYRVWIPHDSNSFWQPGRRNRNRVLLSA